MADSKVDGNAVEVFGVFGGAGHLGHSRGLRGILERELPYRQIEVARVPLHIVAADEATGTEVLLNRGDLVEAVLASTAIPGVFAPVIIGAVPWWMGRLSVVRRLPRRCASALHGFWSCRVVSPASAKLSRGMPSDARCTRLRCWALIN